MTGSPPQDVSENEPRKKSRLDDSSLEGGMAVGIEPHPDRLGPDSLPSHEVAPEEPSHRSAEDCVADIFSDDEDKDGEQVCNLCV